MSIAVPNTLMGAVWNAISIQRRSIYMYIDACMYSTMLTKWFTLLHILFLVCYYMFCKITKMILGQYIVLGAPPNHFLADVEAGKYCVECRPGKEKVECGSSVQQAKLAIDFRERDGNRVMWTSQAMALSTYFPESSLLGVRVDQELFPPSKIYVFDKTSFQKHEEPRTDAQNGSEHVAAHQTLDSFLASCSSDEIHQLEKIVITVGEQKSLCLTELKTLNPYIDSEKFKAAAELLVINGKEGVETVQLRPEAYKLINVSAIQDFKKRQHLANNVIAALSDMEGFEDIVHKFLPYADRDAILRSGGIMKGLGSTGSRKRFRSLSEERVEEPSSDASKQALYTTMQECPLAWAHGDLSGVVLPNRQDVEDIVQRRAKSREELSVVAGVAPMVSEEQRNQLMKEFSILSAAHAVVLRRLADHADFSVQAKQWKDSYGSERRLTPELSQELRKWWGEQLQTRRGLELLARSIHCELSHMERDMIECAVMRCI